MGGSWREPVLDNCRKDSARYLLQSRGTSLDLLIDTADLGTTDPASSHRVSHLTDEGMPRMQQDRANQTARLRYLGVPVLASILSLAACSGLPCSGARPKPRKPRRPGNLAKRSLPALATAVAFPNLRFDRPVAFAYPGDGSNLFFVVEQHTATIWSFPTIARPATRSSFSSFPTRSTGATKKACSAWPFIPSTRKTRQFFVYYSANDRGKRRSVVSRFRASSNNPAAADPASEERIWVSAEDPFENHNGGTIAFGPDGYLYITLGDGGAADDPMSSGQNPGDWFASILRIDVDHPFGRQALRHSRRQPRPAGAKVLALGSRGLLHRPAKRVEIQLRPPDRRALGRRRRPEPLGDGAPDRERGQLRLEHHGSVPPVSAPAPATAGRGRQDPAADRRVSPCPDRDRPDSGLSITGGYVYRGKKLPALAGVYVYGDFDSGRIWGLRYENGKLIANGELIDLQKSPKLNIASFGEDADGELYILAFDGRIHEFCAGERHRRPIAARALCG